MKAKSWEEIKEVDRALASIRNCAWVDLYVELSLRLECTDTSHALAVPFGNHKLAASAQTSLRKQFAQSEHVGVEILLRKTDDGAVLFVSHKQPRKNGAVHSRRPRPKQAEFEE